MHDSDLTPRQLQALQTKNKIYTSAVKLIEATDSENIKIEDICREANVSIGTFYHYYDSKQDVVNELLKNIDELYFKYLVNHLSKENSLERILEFFDYLAMRLKLKTVTIWRQLFNFSSIASITNSIYGKSSFQLLLSIIKTGQEKNEITTEVSAEEITNYIMIMYRGILFDWCFHDGEYDIEIFMHKYMKRFIFTFQK